MNAEPFKIDYLKRRVYEKNPNPYPPFNEVTPKQLHAVSLIHKQGHVTPYLFARLFWPNKYDKNLTVRETQHAQHAAKLYLGKLVKLGLVQRYHTEIISCGTLTLENHSYFVPSDLPSCFLTIIPE